jgi:hypothetical protein
MPSKSDRQQTKTHESRNRATRSPPSPNQQETPPKEARTDPDRGTGELGGESLDPSKPLKETVGQALA